MQGANFTQIYSPHGLHIRITWFSSKTSDTAPFYLIDLTRFKCISGASATKCALTWTHYDDTEAYRANSLTVHLSSGATRADLGGILNNGKWRRQQGVHLHDFDAMFFTNKYGVNPYSYTGFLSLGAVFEMLNKGFQGPSALGLHLADDVCSFGRRCYIQVWVTSSLSNHWISHFKTPLT